MPGKPKSTGRKQLSATKSSALRQLESLRLRYDHEATISKTKLLKAMRSRKITNLADLQAYHEILCFLRAYPDKQQLLNLAESELRSFGHRVRLAFKTDLAAALAALTDSGIVDTAVEHPFSFELARILLKHYPKALEIDWNNSDDFETGNLLGILPLIVAWQENDAIDNDDDITAQSFLKRSRPQKAHSDLETLIGMLECSTLQPDTRRHLFEEAEIQSRWDLRNSPASRTLSRVLRSKLFFQTEPIKPRSKDLRAEILSKPTPLKRLSLRDGEIAVRLVNEVLAVRSRELFCITHANPAEVYLVEPGRGVQIYFYGSKPEIRLPLEANFGALLVRNGMPIGYGVGACIFDRVEIAINIFPTFRTGESPFIIEQFFKAFYHHFGSRVFVVRSRQMGDGDDEPIFAGSFWFYYKLGFRAARPTIRALAEREYQRIVRNPNHRSSIAMLRRLSKSDVFMHIDPNQMTRLYELSVTKLAYCVTDLAARRFDGNRVALEWFSARALAKTLKLTNCRLWSEREQEALFRMGPIMASIPNLASWSQSERETLVKLIRAKGKPLEREFVLQCIRHPKLKHALVKLTKS